MLLFRRYRIAKLLKFIQLGTCSTLKCWNSLRVFFPLPALESLAFSAQWRTIKHSRLPRIKGLALLQLHFNESLRQNWHLPTETTVLLLDYPNTWKELQKLANMLHWGGEKRAAGLYPSFIFTSLELYSKHWSINIQNVSNDCNP